MAKRAKRTSRKPARKAKSAARTKLKRSKAGPSKARKAAKKAKAKAPVKARAATKRKASSARKAAPKARPARKARAARVTQAVPGKTPRLDRARRRLDEADLLPTPPSSLDMDRKGSAARSGRAEMLENLREHASMEPSLTAGDVDANIENAYFSGDETPGGDNSTPDQDVVDEIGRAVGIEYDDAEELKGSDKVTDRDKHRWELDPASSEDYRDRK